MTAHRVANADHLPCYTSHKVVRAAPILSMRAQIDGWHVTVATGDAPTKPLTLVVPDDTFRRGTPQPGDMLVIYDDQEDGGHYVSWSPRHTFDKGYQRDEGQG